MEGFRFFDLPREIRDAIYDMCIGALPVTPCRAIRRYHVSWVETFKATRFLLVGQRFAEESKQRAANLLQRHGRTLYVLRGEYPTRRNRHTSREYLIQLSPTSSLGFHVRSVEICKAGWCEGDHRFPRYPDCKVANSCLSGIESDLLGGLRTAFPNLRAYSFKLFLGFSNMRYWRRCVKGIIDQDAHWKKTRDPEMEPVVIQRVDVFRVDMNGAKMYSRKPWHIPSTLQVADARRFLENPTLKLAHWTPGEGLVWDWKQERIIQPEIQIALARIASLKSGST